MLIRIGELGKVVTGKTPPTKQTEYFGEDHPFITPTDISDYNIRYIDSAERYLSQKWADKQPQYLLPKDSICYVCIGSTVGKMCLTKIPSFTNQQINSIICDQTKTSSYYLFYKLRLDTPQIQSIADGKGVGKSIINKSEFEDLKLEIPSLPIQLKIASILSTYDDLIENNNRRIKILEETAQTIYNEWFVKFCFPGHSKVKMINSELGKIPEGWKAKRVLEIIETHIGGGWGSNNSDEKHNIPAYVIRGTDIPSVKYMSIENCPLRFHTQSNFIPRKLEVNDIVIEVSGGGKEQAVGRALLVTKKTLDMFKGDAICASFCKRIKVKNNILFPLLFIHHLNEIYANNKIEQYQVQSTGIKNFKFDTFLNKEIVLIPPQEIQSSFSNIVDVIIELKDSLGAKNAILRQARDLLLPRLISGELDVENLDIKVAN